MKPLLPLDLLLGGGGVGPVQRGPSHRDHAASASDELQHRLLQIVWADGEDLATATPTRGTALLQHGFKEWSGALGVCRPAGTARAATPRSRTDPGAVLQAVRECEAENWLPLVLCRNLDAPLHVLAAMLAEGPCALLAVGAPAACSLQPVQPDLARTLFPVPLPSGVDPGRCLWLGAPDAATALPLPVPAGLRIGRSRLYSAALPHRLHDVERSLRASAPSSLWCLLFLDDVALDDAAAASGRALPAQALAATLRWLQGQPLPVVAFMVSHERVTVAERGRVAELARHLGTALFRHRGVQRRPFAAAGGG